MQRKYGMSDNEIFLYNFRDLYNDDELFCPIPKAYNSQTIIINGKYSAFEDDIIKDMSMAGYFLSYPKREEKDPHAKGTKYSEENEIYKEKINKIRNNKEITLQFEPRYYQENSGQIRKNEDNLLHITDTRPNSEKWLK